MLDRTAAEGRRPFTLRPFRGLRFDPATVGDLGTVISPPYDVLDADTVRDLEAANRHNIVRLILSRRFERPYLAVRDRLHKWRDRSFLRADADPALYLYEYTVGDTTVRGLVGVTGLRAEDERVILPHEDVMPGPVDDRAVLMRTTETNLEPILLLHEGTDRLRTLVREAATEAPLADFVALDGSRHRLWAVSEPARVDALAGELADTQALIADGHHRYAAYLRLQQERRDPTAAPETSPWDHGLALLVDQRDHPLTVGPIHRSVGALTIADLQELSDDRGDEFRLMPDREAAFAAQAARVDDPERAAFVVSDGRTWALLRTARTSEVDAAVLHDVLLPAWRIAEEQVGYHHSLDQALQTTARQPGVVVAVHPPSVAQVMAAAARGERMPRKSTSFAPKPRMGVVMRDLRDS
ncbi:MAG: DUF1015 domain-containing protein [Nocardioidaceae bacterium]|nr:DUF1015 domain-containing protein [Nocardioidaceae bacterium]